MAEFTGNGGVREQEEGGIEGHGEMEGDTRGRKNGERGMEGIMGKRGMEGIMGED